MGSHTFYDTSKEADVDKAYAKLVADALFEFGHEPYNGTISTTSGFRVVSKTPVTQAEADRIAGSRIDALHKWDACEAIAVGVPTRTRKRKVKVVVTPKTHGQAELTSSHVVAALGIASAELAGYEVTAVTPKYTVTNRPAGPARKVWEVRGLRDQFATQAEAKKAARAAVAALKAPTQTRPTHWVNAPGVYEITQRVVREPEAAVVPELVSVTFAVEAEVATGAIKFDRWLFYGWAAS